MSMTPRQMLDGLAAAELAHAHFNALRTCGPHGEYGIRRGQNVAFDYLVDPSRPASPYYNRAVGIDAGALPVKLALALPPGVAAVELSPSQLNAALAAQLLDAGFKPAFTMCYLGCAPRGGEVPGWQVQRLGAEDTEQFFDLLAAQGVPFPPDKRELKRAFYCTDAFRCYVARQPDGTAVATATMHVQDGVAFLGNAHTAPAHRGAGAHRALLAARLGDAAALGLRVAYTDVEHGSASHRNCEAAGLRTLSINTVWKLQTPP